MESQISEADAEETEELRVGDLIYARGRWKEV